MNKLFEKSVEESVRKILYGESEEEKISMYSIHDYGDYAIFIQRIGEPDHNPTIRIVDDDASIFPDDYPIFAEFNNCRFSTKGLTKIILRLLEYVILPE